MSQNRGHQFQEDLKNSSNSVNIILERIHDHTHGFKSLANFADFYLYRYPTLVYLELKSTKGKYFQVLGENAHFTPTQFEGLLEHQMTKGCQCGFLVEFQNYHSHFYLPIGYINELRHQLADKKRKSIKVEDIPKKYLVESTLKRTRYNLNLENIISVAELHGC